MRRVGGRGHRPQMIGGPDLRERVGKVQSSSSLDAFGVVRNLPAGAAAAALDPVVAFAHPGLDLQEDLQTDRSVVEANSQSPAWRLIVGSSEER